MGLQTSVGERNKIQTTVLQQPEITIVFLDIDIKKVSYGLFVVKAAEAE